MAITLVHGLEYVWPGHPNTNNNVAITLDADGESYAATGRIPIAGTINKIHVPFGTVGQAPANGVKASLQGRTGSASITIPDGTPTHYRTIAQGSVAANTFVATGKITDDGTDDGAQKTVAVGDIITVVITFDTFQSSDSVTVNYFSGGDTAFCDMRTGFLTYKIGASWTTTQTLSPNIVLEYDDGTFIPFPAGLIGVGGIGLTAVTITTVASPDEIGIKFVAPLDGKIGGPCPGELLTVDSLWTLYDSDDTELATRTVDWDNDVPAGAYGQRKVYFDTPQSVTAGSTYRMTLKSPGAGSNYLYYRTYGAGIGADVNISGGADCVLTERTDSGAWTDTTTRKPLLGVFYTEFVSGGGVPQSLHPIEAGITA